MKFYSFGLILLIFTSCKQDDKNYEEALELLLIHEQKHEEPTLVDSPEKTTNDTVLLHWAQYYGQCFGNCLTTVNIYSNKVLATSRSFFEKKQVPEFLSLHNTSTIEKTYFLDEKEAANLFNIIQCINLSEYPKVIGCPDCRDQGGEFLVINGEMIQLEAYESIEGLEEILNICRKYKNSM